MRRSLPRDPAAARDSLLATVPGRRRRLGLPTRTDGGGAGLPEALREARTAYLLKPAVRPLSS
ncbi:hypothetical protein JCM9534A_61270 [Catenuloplanes indicus JCM 9534]